MKIFIYPYNLYSKYCEIYSTPWGPSVYFPDKHNLQNYNHSPTLDSLYLVTSLVSNVNIGLFSPIVCATRKTSTDLNTKIKVCST